MLPACSSSDNGTHTHQHSPAIYLRTRTHTLYSTAHSPALIHHHHTHTHTHTHSLTTIFIPLTTLTHSLVSTNMPNKPHVPVMLLLCLHTCLHCTHSIDSSWSWVYNNPFPSLLSPVYGLAFCASTMTQQYLHGHVPVMLLLW